eukprot:CAMPEP_0197929058 /NCGR_PEP_ID=MMETSP1439-20131203/103298_1 /TAXON_ID=66791 /ORGANISM="Gonyaulax spinifera, Strain CCMP409" /LENGTH=201 /DNA_ID=CAMNT_0043551683 /DNA_START=129 /DNA_END=731 /DNA_ORIENTATION=+
MASMCKAGLVVGLNEVLEYHMQDVSVQECGTQALDTLAARSGSREIIATGGMVMLLKILAEHPDNTYIQRASWSCLDLLVSNAGALTRAMREEVVKASDLFPAAAEVASTKSDRNIIKKVERLSSFIRTCVAGAQKPVFVSTQLKKQEEAPPEEVRPVEQEGLDLREWLSGLDRTGALSQYHGVLAQNFDSVPHVVDAYTE